MFNLNLLRSICVHSILYSRPTPSFSSPAQVLSHTFLLDRSAEHQDELAHLIALIDKLELSQVTTGDRIDIYQNIHVELRIEKHHEFICCIYIIKGEDRDTSATNTIKAIQQWLTRCKKKPLTQTHISFNKGNMDVIPKKQLFTIFGNNQLNASYVDNESARIWTSFYTNECTDKLQVQIEDLSLGPRRSGRLAQNLIDIENYRCLSALAFPLAQEIVFSLSEKEQQLATIVQSISEMTNTEKEQALLHQLLDLSVNSETWRSKTSHRFSASAAYQKIFDERLSELDESKVLGYQLIGNFLSRAAMPYYRTCQAGEQRLTSYILRIDRAVALLSTRIRATIEEQNNALLLTATKQNKQQMVLQETVEAFSIIAISYYASSILKYALESIHYFGFPLSPYKWVGVGLPIILGSTYVLMKYLRKRKTDD